MLSWMLVFLLSVVLILGHVRYYELTLANERRLKELQQLQQELEELKRNRQQQVLNLETEAEALGLYLPQPEDYITIYVGREEPSAP